MVSGLDSGNRKDYSKYDEMSTESLEELLRLDTELPDGEGSDIDEILYISEVIAKREREHPTGRYSEADVDAAWERFKTNYLPYVTDGRSLYDFDDDEPNHTEAANPVSDISSLSNKKRISPRGRRLLGRMVSLAAVIAVLLGLLTVTAYAMGYDLWGVVAQWTKDTFTFVSAAKADNAEIPNTSNTEDKYGDLQVALDAFEITEPLAPNWFPEGFKLNSVNVDETSNPQAVLFQADYSRDEQWIIIQITMHLHADNATYTEWQKNDEDVITISIENCTFYVMSNAERGCAVWSNGPFECSIIGDITSEEITMILQSIYVKDDR